MEELLSRLGRKLGLTEPDAEESVLLYDSMKDAEGELLLYLNREELLPQMEGKVVELAAIFYRRDAQELGGVKASSYSEGDVSQSQTFATERDYQEAVDALLRSVAHWRRRVRC